MQSPLDEDIDRRAVPALKTHRIVLGDDGENLFAAGVADMDFKAPPPVLAALKHRLDHGIFGYETLPDGLMPALTGWQKDRHGWQIDPAHILRAPNILNALAIAASVLTDDGDGIIIQPPVFFDFRDILNENHRRIVSNPLILESGHYRMDFEGLEALACEPRNKMIYLCNPHNPIGRVWSRQDLVRLGDICARNGVIVVADEIHADITFSGHNYTPFASLGAKYANNSVTCLSPAKSFNIAACCAAFTVVSNGVLRQAIQVENSRLTVNKNNAFASVAMQAAYAGGGPWLDDVLTYLEGNLDMVRKEIDRIAGVNLIEPQGTFLVWLDFRGLGFPPKELTRFLRQKAGWAVTRGEAFGIEGEGFARLNIACTRAKLRSALENLSAAIKSQPV